MLIRPRTYRPTKVVNGLTCWMNFAQATLPGIGTIFGNTQGQAQRVVDFAGRPAYKFDGSTAWISLTADPLASLVTDAHNFVLCCWVYLPSASLNGCFIHSGAVTDGSGSGGGFGMGVGSTDWDTPGNHLVGAVDQVAWVQNNITIGTGWHHIAIERRGDGGWGGYVDSVMTDYATATTPTQARTGAQIGKDCNSSPRLCPAGVILSDVRYYIRTLTPLEYRAIMSEAYGPAIDVETIALMHGNVSSSFLAAWARGRNVVVDGVAT